MSFVDAVKTVLSKYASFSGRARRSELWFWLLALLGAGVTAAYLDQAAGTRATQAGPTTAALVLALLVPNLAVQVRRLHDIGRSGWLVLLGLIPVVGAVALVVLFATDSQARANQYGPSPKVHAYP